MMLIIKTEQLYEKKENRPAKEGHVVGQRFLQGSPNNPNVAQLIAKSSWKVKTFQQSPIVKDDNSMPSRGPCKGRK